MRIDTSHILKTYLARVRRRKRNFSREISLLSNFRIRSLPSDDGNCRLCLLLLYSKSEQLKRQTLLLYAPCCWYSAWIRKKFYQFQQTLFKKIELKMENWVASDNSCQESSVCCRFDSKSQRSGESNPAASRSSLQTSWTWCLNGNMREIDFHLKTVTDLKKTRYVLGEVNLNSATTGEVGKDKMEGSPSYRYSPLLVSKFLWISKCSHLLKLQLNS